MFQTLSKLKILKRTLLLMALLLAICAFFCSISIPNAFADDESYITEKTNCDDTPQEGINFLSDKYNSVNANFFVAVCEKNLDSEYKIVSLVERNQTVLLKSNQKLVVSFANNIINAALLKSNCIIHSLTTEFKINDTVLTDVSVLETTTTTTKYLDYCYETTNGEGLLSLSVNYMIGQGLNVSEARSLSFSCYVFNESTYQVVEGEAPCANVDYSTDGNVENYIKTDVLYARVRYHQLGKLITPPYVKFDFSKFDISIKRSYQGMQYDYQITDGAVVKGSVNYPDLWLVKDESNCTLYFKDLGIYTLTYTYKFNGIMLSSLNNSLALNLPDQVHVFGYQALYSSEKQELRDIAVLTDQTKVYQADVTYMNLSITDENPITDSSLSTDSFAKTNLAPITLISGANISAKAAELYKKVNDAWGKCTFSNLISEPGTYFVKVTYTYSLGINIDTQYTQFFAFILEPSNPTLEIKTQPAGEGDGEIIYNNNYTKENVNISYNKLGGFEGDVVVRVSFSNDYTNTFTYLAGFENFSLKENALDCSCAENGKYRIEILYGANLKNKVFSYFYIDKMAIEGLGGVFTSKSVVDGSFFKNELFESDRLFVSEKFALVWNNKISGAKIVTKYSFVPLVKSSSIVPSVYSSNMMISNGYMLDFDAKSEGITAQNTRYLNRFTSQFLFSTPGLYVFNAKDSAGNEATFKVIYDNSPVYFMQTDGISSVPTHVENFNTVSKDTTVVWGANKLILLKGVFVGQFDESLLFSEPVEENANEFLINKIKRVDKTSVTAKTTVTLETGAISDEVKVLITDAQANERENFEQYYYYAYDQSHRNFSTFSSEYGIKPSTDQSVTDIYVTENNKSTSLSSIKQDIKTETINDQEEVQVADQYYRATAQSAWLSFKDLSAGTETIESVTYTIDFYEQMFDSEKKTLYYSEHPINYYVDDFIKVVEDGFVKLNLNFNSQTRTRNGKYVITRTYTLKVGQSNAFNESKDYVVRRFNFYVDTNEVLTYESEQIKVVNGEDITNVPCKEIGEYIDFKINGTALSFKDFFRQNQSVIFDEDGDLKVTEFDPIIVTNYMPNTLMVPKYKYGSVSGAKFNHNFGDSIEEYIEDFLLSTKVLLKVNNEVLDVTEFFLAMDDVTSTGYNKLSFAKSNFENNKFILFLQSKKVVSKDLFERDMEFYICVSDNINTSLSSTSKDITHDWWFKFTLLCSGPSVELSSSSTTDEGKYVYERRLSYADESGDILLADKSSNNFIYYTNADNIIFNWTDSESQYIAKISQIKVNNDEVYTRNSGSNEKFHICPFVINLENRINVEILYETSGSGDYLNESAYKSTFTIEISKVADETIINSISEGDLMKPETDRVAFDCTNVTTQDLVYKNYAYILKDTKIITDNLNNYDFYYRDITENYKTDFIPYSLPLSSTTTQASPNIFLPVDGKKLTADFFGSISEEKYLEIVQVDKYGNMTHYIIWYATSTTIKEIKINEAEVKNNSAFVVAPGFIISSLAMSDCWAEISFAKVTDSNSQTFKPDKKYVKSNNNILNCFFNKDKEEVEIKKLYEFEASYRYIISIYDRLSKSTITFSVSIYDETGFTKVSSTTNSFTLEERKPHGVPIFTTGSIKRVEVYELSSKGNAYSEDKLANNFSISNGCLTITGIEISTDSPVLIVLTANNFAGEYTFYYEIFSSGEIGTYSFKCADLPNGTASSSRTNYISTDVEFNYEDVYTVTCLRNGLTFNNGDNGFDSNKKNILPVSNEKFEHHTGEELVYILTFELQINSDIEKIKEYLSNYKKEFVFVVNNKMPIVKAYSNNGEDKSSLLNSEYYTSQGLFISFDVTDLEQDDYIVTLNDSKGTLINTISAEGLYVTDQNEYVVRIAFSDADKHAIKEYKFTIKSDIDSAYTVTGTDSDDDSAVTYKIEQSKEFYLDGDKFYPLYITNYNFIRIIKDENLKLTCSPAGSIASAGYTIKKFHISNKNETAVSRVIDETIYILVFDKTNDLQADFSYFNKTSELVQLTGISKDIFLSQNDIYSNINKLTLSVKSYYGSVYNKIRVEVKLGDDIVISPTDALEFSNNNYKFTFAQNGEYSIKIFDDAGNVQQFTYQGVVSNQYTLGFYKSVAFFVNNSSPINFSVFNNTNPVQVKLDEKIKYDESGKPKLEVLLNGLPVDISFENGIYNFTQTGFYEIKFTGAKKTVSVGSATETIEFDTPSLFFTIIDPNDARFAFNWAEYDEYKVTSVVLNNSEILSDGQTLKSYYVSIYNGDQIGEYTITVSPKSKQSVCTLKPFTFTFNLKNASAPIVIDKKQGTVNTDPITVTYNAKNIFDSLGNCKVVIEKNNSEMLSSVIDAQNCLDEQTVSQITDAGDYYIKIYNNSNNLIFSYKVTKKDPLNTIAIIVICVSAVGVAALTFLFIRLRKKVKIK